MLAQQTLVAEPETADTLCIPIGFLNDLNGSMTVKEVLSTYSVWCQKLVHADRCSVALVNDSNSLDVTAMNGSRGFPEGTQHPVEGTVIGGVYSNAQLHYIPDVALVDMPDARFVDSLGYTAAVLAPIVSGTSCFGALSASYKAPITNPNDVISMMSALGRCLATQLVVVQRLDRLSRVARTDHLTKALNRRSLRDRADETWMNWMESGEQFVFITFDLDHFKSVNDTHGHAAGDAVLREVVARTKEVCGRRGSVFRIGGEEFGVLLPATSERTAMDLAETMRHALSSNPFEVAGATLSVTASFGLARPCLADRTFNDVLRRSDDALYAAKEQGRNCVVVAPYHGNEPLFRKR